MTRGCWRRKQSWNEHHQNTELRTLRTFRTSHFGPKSNFEHHKKPNSSGTLNCSFQEQNIYFFRIRLLAALKSNIYNQFTKKTSVKCRLLKLYLCWARSSEQKSFEISLLRQRICHNKVESTRSHVFFECNFSSYTETMLRN